MALRPALLRLCAQALPQGDSIAPASAALWSWCHTHTSLGFASIAYSSNKRYSLTPAITRQCAVPVASGPHSIPYHILQPPSSLPVPFQPATHLTAHAALGQWRLFSEVLPPSGAKPARERRHLVLNSSKPSDTRKNWMASPLHLRFAQPPTFEVIEFFPTGLSRSHQEPRTADQLGLHPRDVSLFTSDYRLTQQRATITCRDGAILFKTEAVKAIIRADKAILFKCRKEADTMRITEVLLGLLQEPQVVHAQAALPFELCVLEVLLHETVQYFERKAHHLNMMMESTLADMQANKGPLLNSEESQALVPIQKLLTTMSSDVRETHEAISNILEEDSTLAAVCLTERSLHLNPRRSPSPYPRAAIPPLPSSTQPPPPPLYQDDSPLPATPQNMHSSDFSSEGPVGRDQLDRLSAAAAELGSPSDPQPMASQWAALQGPPHTRDMQLAATMLETYERQVQSIQSILGEMAEHLENSRDIWHMQLDGSRNHIILVNLYLSFLSIAIMLAAFPATLLGMNLESGMDGENPVNFWWVASFSMMVGALVIPVGKRWYTRQWMQAKSTQELRELRQLRLFLVQHMDDIEAITDAALKLRKAQGMTRIHRDRFQQLIRDSLKGRQLSKASLDFLYRCFDSNRDGFVQEAEFVRNFDLKQRTGFDPACPDDAMVYRDGEGAAPNGNGLFGKLRISRADGGGLLDPLARIRPRWTEGLFENLKERFRWRRKRKA